jgi:anaerobic magnesium-protoporphyrin IX monomethyl ester cyclase
MRSTRILLINPGSRTHTSTRAVLRFDPPVALLNLASFLDVHGYEAEVVDTAVEEIDWDKVQRGEYILIGMTVLIGEFMKNVRSLTAKIRQLNPRTPVCLGGVMASLFPELLLKEYEADFVVRYEGEWTLLELLQHLEGKRPLSDIAGLSWRSGTETGHNAPRFLENDLDVFPVPRWELLGERCNHMQQPYYLRIMTSKGCPFQCSFCYRHGVEEAIRRQSPSWRYRSARHVMTEVESLHQSIGARVFTFGDDNFLVRKERALNIFQSLRAKGFFLEQCIAHINCLRPEIITAMGGLVQTVIYALESASPRLLKLLKKHLDLAQVPEVNRRLFEQGITTTHNFIIGLPGETDEDLRLNVDLMLKLKQINPFVRALTYLFLPLPFTPLFEHIEKVLGLSIPMTIRDLEEANFDSGNEHAARYRPWLTPERVAFVRQYCHVFNDTFQENNQELSEQSLEILRANPRMQTLFRGAEEVRRPKDGYRPYVLDRVLRGETIDLVNDLNAHA